MVLHTDHREWARKSPYQRFFDFIAHDADRYKVLLETLESLELNFTVIEIEGKHHFFIYPPAYKQKIAIKLGSLIYDGLWFTPLREAFSAFVDVAVKTVSGKVKLKLYKGSINSAGASSPNSLYALSQTIFEKSKSEKPKQEKAKTAKPASTSSKTAGKKSKAKK